MIAGWVQPASEKYRKPIETFAEELVQTNKIGGYKFGKANSASFHFLSIKQLLSDPNLKKLEFKIRTKNTDEMPSLVFFLTTKQPTSRLNEPNLEPEIIDIFESNKAEEIIDLNKKNDLSEEKPEDLASPLTNDDNEEKSLEHEGNEMKEEKNDIDIEEIIKKMDSNKHQVLFDEKPSNKTIFEQANIEELTPIKEGEEEEEEKQSLIQSNEPETKHNQELEFNDIIEELKKMKPEELKEFVASFEPDSRGKIASLLKDISKEEVLPNKNENYEAQQVNPSQNQQGFYNNPLYQQNQQIPQQQQQPQNFYANPNLNMANSNMSAFPQGFNNRKYAPRGEIRGSGPNYSRFGGNKPMFGQYPNQM